MNSEGTGKLLHLDFIALKQIKEHVDNIVYNLNAMNSGAAYHEAMILDAKLSTWISKSQQETKQQILGRIKRNMPQELPQTTQRHTAYDEARKFDQQIGELMQKYPVESNVYFWITFCRTVSSGLDIINTICMESLKSDMRYHV